MANRDDLGDGRYLAKKIMDGLKRHRVTFIRKSYYSDEFSDYIKQYGVIQDSKHQELRESHPRERMRELIDYLPRRPEESILWFARALIETDQLFILEEELQLTEAEITYLKSEPAQLGGSISQPRSGTIRKSLTSSKGLDSKEECRAIRKKLTDTEPDMYGNLRCDTELLAYLVKEDVLRDVDRNKLKCIPDTMDRIQALFYLISCNPIPRYKGFLRALVKSGQGHIVTDILQEPLPVNEDDVEFRTAHATMVAPNTDAASNLSIPSKRESVSSTDWPGGKKCRLVKTEIADDQPLDEMSETVFPSASRQPPKTRARGKGKGRGKNKGKKK